MRPFIPLLLLLAPSLLAAEKGANGNKAKVFSLLPDGSELMEVMLPRYDEDHNLIGMLKANAMTLVNDQTMAGETVVIEFYNPDRSLRGRADLSRAVFSQSKGTLEAREPVTLQSDRINATGAGLVYDFEQGEGFLLGPVATWTELENETTMKTSQSTLRATAAIGASLLTQSLTAAQKPASVTDQEKAAIQADAVSSGPAQVAAMASAKDDLAKQLDASTATNAAAKAFLEKSGISSSNNAEPAPTPAEAKPIDLKPGPDSTVISSDGGMYFDSDEGVFVYLKNVRVNSPDFTMSGANELKVYLEKLPAGAAKKADNDAKADKAALDLGGKFGDVERIMASGVIVIEQKPKGGKEAIRASGAIFSYNVKSDLVIISGGSPWVVQGQQGFRAKQPNAILKIKPKAESFSTEGAWDTILQLQKKPK